MLHRLSFIGMTAEMETPLSERTRHAIADVPDFPSPGILFRDITPLLAQPKLLGEVFAEMAKAFVGTDVTHVAGIESRGFIFGVPVSQLLGVPFVPIRKRGKLPRATFTEQFALEYGTDTLAIHTDALTADARVLIVDDVLATGGTAAAGVRLVERAGGVVAGLSMLIELEALGARARLEGLELQAIVKY